MGHCRPLSCPLATVTQTQVDISIQPSTPARPMPRKGEEVTSCPGTDLPFIHRTSELRERRLPEESSPPSGGRTVPKSLAFLSLEAQSGAAVTCCLPPGWLG